ncbi:MAG: glycosyltransferase family protein [Pseudomonadota bacterium]
MLFLSSVAPEFGHFRAAQTVLAALLEETARLGHRVAYATVCTGNQTGPETLDRLGAVDVQFLGDFTPQSQADPAAGQPRWRRWAGYVAELLAPADHPDYPRFTDPARAADALRASGAGVAVLFWDTVFEYLLPALDGLPAIGYLGRPRTEAPLVLVDGVQGALKRGLMRRRLIGRRRRHLRRLRALSAAGNICALDAAWYRANGIDCAYLPNAWPDAFGPGWRERRRTAEAARPGVEILGNIGGLDATGNRFGMAYLGREVLPHLASALDGIDWRINICGRHELPAEVAGLLDHPRIAVRGFIADIDDEVAGNRVFLLLNNAGPYTGGYTRVAYAMASGACLIAHRRLAQSMPELVHGENCLLGEAGAEIAGLLSRAVREDGLRQAIGQAARATYERAYAPARVAQRIADLAARAAA